jgi:hypothetical protein
MANHRRGMCPECSRIVATTGEARVYRHDHVAQRRRVCPGTGRPASNIVPRQLEIPAEQLRLVDLVDIHGNLVELAAVVDEPENLEPEGLFVA